MAIKVLIFGATGGVASYAAKYAISHNADVTLAMRDTSKPVQGLDESKASRVQADLLDPASVAAAASSSGPFHSAFIYQIPSQHGTPKATIQALKDAGVKHIVFLSSYSVTDPVASIPPTDFIPHRHGQIELQLAEIFGEGNFVALRPSYFATNAFQYIQGIKDGLVKDAYPENKADFISPKDIGEVGGYYLLSESSLPKAQDICGQQLLSTRQAVEKIAAAAGKGGQIQIEQISEEESMQWMTQVMKLPPPIAGYLAKISKEEHEGKFSWTEGERWTKGSQAVKKLLGRDGVTFDEWLEENKGAFA